MPTIAQSIVIYAERAALFELAQDYRRRLLWNTFLMEARLLGARPTRPPACGPGASPGTAWAWKRSTSPSHPLPSSR